MRFVKCKAELDAWMREVDVAHKHVTVYINNLAIASKTTLIIVAILEDTWKFKLKGTGPIKCHLDVDFFRDKDGALCFTPKKCVKKMMGACFQMFGDKPPQNASLPLEHGDHHEFDDS